MAGKIALGIPCEVCGSDQWYDNRNDKKNPKAPDYKCSGSGCKEESGYPVGRWEKNRAMWGKTAKPVQSAPPKPQEPAGAPKGGRLTGDDTTPDERGERVYTWEAMIYTYGVLYRKVAETVIKTLGFQEGGTVDQNAVQAGVATLLIQGEKAHIPLLHPRKVTKQDVQKPAPKPQPLEEFPEALEEDFEPWP